MAITKVAQFVTPPVDVDDYDAQNAHIAGFTRQLAGPSMALTEWENSSVMPKLALGTYLSHGGYLYRVATEDYVISGTPTDGTWYIRLEASGDTLIATWINSLSGYAWNAVNNGLYNSDKQLMAYQLVKAGAVLTKRKIMNLWQGGGFQTVDKEGKISVAGLTLPSNDITPTSTNNPLQIGEYANVNMVFDGNQILARENGDLATLYLNRDSGAKGDVAAGNFRSANVNPPVDNNDTTIPALGIGGISYAVGDLNVMTVTTAGTYIILETWYGGGAGLDRKVLEAGDTITTRSGSGYILAIRIA